MVGKKALLLVFPQLFIGYDATTAICNLDHTGKECGYFLFRGLKKNSSEQRRRQSFILSKKSFQGRGYTGSQNKIQLNVRETFSILILHYLYYLRLLRICTINNFLGMTLLPTTFDFIINTNCSRFKGKSYPKFIFKS